MWKRIFSLSLLLSVSISIAFANDAKLEKTIVRSFETNSKTSLEIGNKYGDIIINSWEKDSISVMIQVTAYGKNEDAAEKLMERIEFDFDQSLDFIDIRTVFDRKSGWMNDFWNSISDASKSILNSNKIRVDYEIYMPTQLKLEILNKYGDVFIEEREGETRVELSNGNLKTDHLSGNVHLDLSFGDADIKELDKARLKLKAVDAQIPKADELRLTSSGSDILIDSVKSVNVDSRNDKIRIKELTYANGKGVFSKIYISSIVEKATLDLNYGMFRISDVSDYFSEIEINSKSTDISLVFNQNAYFDADVTAREDRLVYPKNKYSLKIREEEDKLVSLTGTMGDNRNDKSSRLKIYAQNGDVEIGFSPNL